MVVLLANRAAGAAARPSRCAACSVPAVIRGLLMEASAGKTPPPAASSFFTRFFIANVGLLMIIEGGSSTPANAYVSEDGITAYVAEDGTTFYVQESQMTVKKLSQIASAPSAPALTDTVVGVSGGTTDYQYTFAQALASQRIVLTQATTYYVSTTGSDSTGDGSIGKPWATGQNAYNFLVGGNSGPGNDEPIGTTPPGVDFNGHDVTIQFEDGTYNIPFSWIVMSAPWAGGGQLFINGNASDPTKVVINGPTATQGISVTMLEILGVLNIFSFTISNFHNAVYSNAVGQVQVDTIILGGNVTNAFETIGSGVTMTVSGLIQLGGPTANSVIFPHFGSTIEFGGDPLVFTGAISFSYGFIRMNDPETVCIFTPAGTRTGFSNVTGLQAISQADAILYYQGTDYFAGIPGGPAPALMKTVSGAQLFAWPAAGGSVFDGPFFEAVRVDYSYYQPTTGTRR